VLFGATSAERVFLTPAFQSPLVPQSQKRRAGRFTRGSSASDRGFLLPQISLSASSVENEGGREESEDPSEDPTLRAFKERIKTLGMTSDSVGGGGFVLGRSGWDEEGEVEEQEETEFPASFRTEAAETRTSLPAASSAVGLQREVQGVYGSSEVASSPSSFPPSPSSPIVIPPSFNATQSALAADTTFPSESRFKYGSERLKAIYDRTVKKVPTSNFAPSTLEPPSNELPLSALSASSSSSQQEVKDGEKKNLVVEGLSKWAEQVEKIESRDRKAKIEIAMKTDPTLVAETVMEDSSDSAFAPFFSPRRQLKEALDAEQGASGELKEDALMWQQLYAMDDSGFLASSSEEADRLKIAKLKRREWLKQVELKHGRLAILAALSWAAAFATNGGSHIIEFFRAISIPWVARKAAEFSVVPSILEGVFYLSDWGKRVSKEVTQRIEKDLEANLASINRATGILDKMKRSERVHGRLAVAVLFCVFAWLYVSEQTPQEIAEGVRDKVVDALPLFAENPATDPAAVVADLAAESVMPPGASVADLTVSAGDVLGSVSLS